jgi:predicted TIM-barrel fold metal-dependent hydrolase
MATSSLTGAHTQTMRSIRVIDCDVHFKPVSAAAITDYLPEPWRSHEPLRRALTKAPVLNPYTGAMRLDAKPADGPVGSDPALVGQQLFVDAGVDLAINIPVGEFFCPLVVPELNAAFSGAVNEWQATTWLGAFNRHGRYRGSISVAVNDVPAAVREIEKWAGHPGFVQVLVPHHAPAPYGSPQFDPIWEAAARHGLPVAVHSNAGVENYCTPVGHMQRYPEYNGIGFSLFYAQHLVSLICGGVFDRFPGLHIVFVEGGFSWYPPLVSRLDRNWERLSGELPALKRKPSSYVRDHVRFSSQPVEEPEDFEDLARMWEWGDAEHVLLFSSDYPHWDFDHPSRAVSPRFGAALRQRVYRDNARELYGFPAERPVDEFDVPADTPSLAG